MEYVVIADNVLPMFFLVGIFLAATYGLCIAWIVSERENNRLHRFLKDHKMEQRYSEYAYVKQELKKKHKNW